MSRRHFKALSTVQFKHNYYADGLCGDLVVSPTAETSILLRKLRMQWGTNNKKKPSSYQLMQERVDANTPLIPLPANLQLRFEMQLTQPALLNFTDFGTLNPKAGNEVYLFENQISGINLTSGTYVSARLIGDYAELSNLTANSSVTVSEPDGSNLFTVAAIQNGTVWEARINMIKRPTGESIPIGHYLLTYTPFASTATTMHVYKDASLLGKGLFGILHLTQGAGKIIDDKYIQEFTSRSVTWRYYVLPAETAISIGSIPYAISSSSPTFTRHLRDINSASPELKSLMEMGNYTQAVEFVADTVTAYSEVPKTSITLTRIVASSTRTIATHLPNPPAGRPSPAVIVKVTP